MKSTTSSSDVADEEQVFITQADNDNESEGQTLKRNEQSRQNATQWVANEEPPSCKTSVEEFTKIDGNSTLISMNGIKANARILAEPDVDIILKSVKRTKYGQPHDEVLLTTDRRFKHNKANEDRIILKDGLLNRKYYGEKSNVKYYQNLILQQIFSEVPQSLHGEFGKHLGNTMKIVAHRET